MLLLVLHLELERELKKAKVKNPKTLNLKMFRDVKEIVFFNNWLMLVMIKLPIVKLTSYRLSRSLVLYQSPGQLHPSVPLL